MQARLRREAFDAVAAPLVTELRSRNVPIRERHLEDLKELPDPLTEAQAQPILEFLVRAASHPQLSGRAPSKGLDAEQGEVWASVVEASIRGLIGERISYDPLVLQRLFDHTMPGSGYQNGLALVRETISMAVESWPRSMLRSSRQWLTETLGDQHVGAESKCLLASALARVDADAARPFVLDCMSVYPGLAYRAMGRVATPADLLQLRARADAAQGEEKRWLLAAVRQAERRLGRLDALS